MLARKLRAAAAAAAGVADPSWNLANAVYQGSPINYFFIPPTELQASEVFFKPDGLKMYIIGTQNDKVYEYNLSTAWDVGTASYLQDFSVSAQEINPQGLFFKPDGLKMYVIGSTGDSVYEYDLSTAWDVSTASYLQNFSVAATETFAVAVFFKPDGLKMYIVGTGGNGVDEYNLSTAWDISTASYLQTKSISAQETSSRGLFFKPDGLKMYIVGSSGKDVNEYNLSTAWNVSTASYVRIFFVSPQDSFPQGVFFKPDGLRMYIIGSTTDSIYQYDLSTAWNVSTASYSYPTTEYLSIASQEFSPSGVFFKPDGLKMYVTGYTGDDVNEYNLSTAWAIGTASYSQNFSVVAQDTFPTDLFFKPDGLKMYILGATGDKVYEYNLSTAWDISTASYLQNFSVASQETSPSGVFFKPDGLKMYVIGTSGDDVNEYNLSTAWDISTASYLQNFSISVQEKTPNGLFFKPDGLKMYVTGATGDDVNEYNLSTAWDVSTASYSQNFSVAAQETIPHGIFFKPDGLKMYIIGSTGDVIWAYDFV